MLKLQKFELIIVLEGAMFFLRCSGSSHLRREKVAAIDILIFIQTASAVLTKNL